MREDDGFGIGDKPAFDGHCASTDLREYSWLQQQHVVLGTIHLETEVAVGT
jgi:hypothetical protein